jgi:hypothetical protein
MPVGGLTHPAGSSQGHPPKVNKGGRVTSPITQCEARGHAMNGIREQFLVRAHLTRISGNKEYGPFSRQALLYEQTVHFGAG